MARPRARLVANRKLAVTLAISAQVLAVVLFEDAYRGGERPIWLKALGGVG